MNTTIKNNKNLLLRFIKELNLLLVAFISLNAMSSNENKLIYYSLFLERDLEGIILLQQYQNGEVGGMLGSFGGYRWIKDTYTNPSSNTLTFIQPIDIDTQSSSMEFYMPSKALVENFEYSFEESGNDYLVHFFSQEAINSLKGFMAQRQSFSLATYSEAAWFAGIYIPVYSLDVWKYWADNNPSTYCQMVSSPLVKSIKNLDLNISDIGRKMEEMGYLCDEYYNLIKSPENHINDDEDIDELPDKVSVSSGSGFSISTKGYVITNSHVTDDCKNIQIKNSAKSYDALLVLNDSVNDLALLKADFKPNGILAISDKAPSLLEDIFVAGFPYGDSYSDTLKITKGIISALVGIGNNTSEIQIDAAIQPGNSGGPIIDNRGNIVGVTVSSLNKEYFLESYGSIPENTNFGVKAETLRNFVKSSNAGIQLKAPSRFQAAKDELSKLLLNSSVKIMCLND